MAFEEGTTYYVSSEEDDTVLLAIDAKITENGVEWFDTVRDRAFPVESIQTEGRVMTVQTGDATYRFEPLTLELYLDKVADQVAGERAFASTEELQAFYGSFPG